MRLIDADAVINGIRNRCLGQTDVVKVEHRIIDMLNRMPAVDTEPVIRCSECKFVGTDATCCLVCKREGMGLKPYHVYHDDYCSYAERKE